MSTKCTDEELAFRIYLHHLYSESLLAKFQDVINNHVEETLAEAHSHGIFNKHDWQKWILTKE